MFKNLEDKEIQFILENNYIGQLGYIYNNRPYVIPITYFFDKESNIIICYSGDGHKMNAMRKNNAVSLQIGEIKSVTNWKSVLVHGTFEQHFGSNAKAYLHKFSLGIKDIILEKEQKKANFISEFSSKIYKDNIPAVFLIRITEITGKKRNTTNVN
ncbi:pyridoxamine 5'-phosphate oxidase family protein [Yeosuana sp. MJ-SS3]|uniref:Pyridoxamine 5'-phosphate oxidase family protein n=1 Tax=Gilvirhabdus luticola TaxID=3079858 RepID=A0ABU3U5P6_9FLAO|nr:pyridoxamine 5'-phosphate oxidase family protein [Yeosuana sp. MJ-SS3]MDU8885681.1 pyridoxamine 5'-phosphate oxidase family protein [Yeosuana sp. MJ-SS3]